MVATDIRKEARESLKNKWVKAILIILIQFLITGLLTGIENALGDNSKLKEGKVLKRILNEYKTKF